jgi:hypothetical protein
MKNAKGGLGLRVNNILRLALEWAGHKCIDKFARQIYKANFDTEGEVEWQILLPPC